MSAETRSTIANSSPSSINRTTSLRTLLGPSSFSSIASCHVLVVGAGGIGCELLKNLVLTGFQHIEIIDLDTIDVSNLNRQFLFRRQHVGQPKSVIARESVLAMNPHANIQIIARHDNIKNPDFNHDYFKKFSLVMNALDNAEARRHVNRLCLATQTPLIESGTQGYAGQVTVIQQGKTACYECEPAPSAKTFAVCTIRNTPDKPVHCIVWAKHIYSTLFGPVEEDNPLNDIRIHIGEGEEEREGFGRRVFKELFEVEIQKQREVEDRWKGRNKPIVLELDKLLNQLHSDQTTSTSSSSSFSSSSSSSSFTYTRSHDQTALTLPQTVSWFLSIVSSLLSTRSSSIGNLTFDKDDDLCMDFVTAASNLRCYCFGITPQSRFAAKGIAGNIVHAIATTNAIAAGLIVLEAIKILNQKVEDCKTSWISKHTQTPLRSQMIDPPKKGCYVCGQSTLYLRVDTSKWTLRQLYEKILIKKLSFVEPIVDVHNRDNYIGTLQEKEEEEKEQEDEEDEGGEGEGEGEKKGKVSYLNRPLRDVTCNDGAELIVEDQRQEMKVKMIIIHDETIEEGQTPELFTLTGSANKTVVAEDESETVMKGVEQGKGDVAEVGGKGKEEVKSNDSGRSKNVIAEDEELLELDEQTYKHKATSSSSSSFSSSSAQTSSIANGASKKRKAEFVSSTDSNSEKKSRENGNGNENDREIEID